MFGLFNPFVRNDPIFSSNGFLQNLVTIFLKDLNYPTNQAIISWFGTSNVENNINEKKLYQFFTKMAKDGIINDKIISASHFIISMRQNLGILFSKVCSSKSKIGWSSINRKDSARHCFETRFNSFNSQLPLQNLLEALEGCLISAGLDTPWNNPVLFVADLEIKTVNKPKSILARIWNECLGPTFIPFDPVAREALIEHGKKHSELKQHIEKWLEMKRKGSKWAAGEW
jgi:hypothetical protein